LFYLIAILKLKDYQNIFELGSNTKIITILVLLGAIFLIGVPPFLGFFLKLAILVLIIKYSFLVAMIILAASLIITYYYLMILFYIVITYSGENFHFRKTSILNPVNLVIINTLLAGLIPRIVLYYLNNIIN